MPHDFAWAIRVVCSHYEMPEWDIPDDLLEPRLIAEAERIDVMREIAAIGAESG
jgi:hypothetical protein